MLRPNQYNTKQRAAILDFIRSLDGAHITATEIAAHFKTKGQSVGRATVYRHLDRLAEDGLVRKYTTGDGSGACYQYSAGPDDTAQCSSHFHLKCEDCGALFHLDCDSLRAIRGHVSDRHRFWINLRKTVFYGRCAPCEARLSPEEKNETEGRRDQP